MVGVTGGGGGGGVKLLGEWKRIRASAFWGLLARMASALKIKCPTPWSFDLTRFSISYMKQGDEPVALSCERIGTCHMSTMHSSFSFLLTLAILGRN